MSGRQFNGRPVGSTENSWCLAVPGGTGIAVLAISLSKHPDSSLFQDALQKLQNSHPILRSRLHTNPNTNSFSLITAPNPIVQVKNYNLTPACEILNKDNSNNLNVSKLQLVLEHEMNENAWVKIEKSDLLFASIYALPNVNKWVVVIRLHVTACDRTTAVSLLRELLGIVGRNKYSGVELEILKKDEVNLGIEELIPDGKGKKGWWTRGVDVLSYSVNSLRLTNLKFKDSKSQRFSQVVRLQISQADTEKILNVCKRKSIKLSSVLTAAGLIAAHGSKRRSSSGGYMNMASNQLQHKKYGVVTLTDCRSLLQPPLSSNTFGFYHSAVLNTHVIKGGENLWDLAQKIYTTFSNYKNCNRHFSDMADLNFLMCRAIENPGLTSSSSLRTSFMSVFEDSVVDKSDPMQEEIGLDDYMGCASVHGIGPSIAVFDTIRDGKLDCVCVYPAPLHSRAQMEELIENMKTLLVNSHDV